MNGGRKELEGHNNATKEACYKRSAVHKALKADVVKDGHRALCLPAFRNMIGTDVAFLFVLITDT